MENLLLLFATSFVLKLSSSRVAKNYSIGETGCSVFLFSNEVKFRRSRTKTGDHLYSGGFFDNGVTYGVIYIKLNHLYEIIEAEALLRIYIDNLKKPFFISHSTGMQISPNWNSISALSVVDYWQDIDGVDWKIKGYTDGESMAVLYVKNINHEHVKREDLFLDSFYFRTNN